MIAEWEGIGASRPPPAFSVARETRRSALGLDYSVQFTVHPLLKLICCAEHGLLTSRYIT